ncbi:MAG: acetate--CoA ligase family protein [Anaerolineales bacterium]|nr:acetate--CoA ligase family protein [Anaerolineales bacterium]
MLDSLFNPASIAIIGASRTEGKLGYAILANVIESKFSGPIYPINPTPPQPGESNKILGWPVYTSLADVPGPIGLAVIVIPANRVMAALGECAAKGVGAVIVISAGFRETGSEGLKLERRMAQIAQEHNMPIVGPNCLGVIDTVAPYNASFAVGMPRRGTIAFMSQSGALCTGILDVALAQNIGFSRFVSLGNKAHLNELDFLESWAEDPETKVMMAYLEGIADGEHFIREARRITKVKPVIAIKSGFTSGGSRAVSSHTGTLAGSERAYEAAFKQAGVLRANSISDLFDLAVAFARQPLPRGNQIAIVTNAGGPGIMATDALEKSGLKIASLNPSSQETLRQALPAAASVLNPIDVLGDARSDRYKIAFQAALADDNVDALVVILTPQFMTEIEETAKALADAFEAQPAGTRKPVVACFIGEAHMKEASCIFSERHIPSYPTPERAAAALKAMVTQAEWAAEPLPQFQEFEVDRETVARIFAQVRADGRVTIGDAESRDILTAYGIRVPKSKLCPNAEEAVAFAAEIGYPVVMKIASPDILHKTDVGGVRVGLESPTDVRDAFDLMVYRAQKFQPNAQIWGCLVQEQVRGGKEVITGMNRDPQFGPLVMFGLGGIYVEVLKDVSFRIAPFDRKEALAMIREIRSFGLLRGVRGEPPADLDATAETLLCLSQLVTDFPEIVEMDINPLMVFEKGRGVMGVDMRLVLKS